MQNEDLIFFNLVCTTVYALYVVFNIFYLLFKLNKSWELNNIQGAMKQWWCLFWWSTPWQDIELFNQPLCNGDGTQGDLTLPFNSWERNLEDMYYSVQWLPYATGTHTLEIPDLSLC